MANDARIENDNCYLNVSLVVDWRLEAFGVWRSLNVCMRSAATYLLCLKSNEIDLFFFLFNAQIIA